MWITPGRSCATTTTIWDRKADTVYFKEENAMKYMKLLLALALVLCMAMSLCACGNDSKETNPSDQTPAATTKGTEDTTAPVDTGKVTYTVTVVDQDGNPIAGAMVQMCKDACVPGMTNENGVAEYSLAEDAYKVSFLSIPAGYTYSSDVTEFYFENGAHELTITLKAEG